MKTNKILVLAACAGLLGSCAATAPNELLNAREAYRRASTGETASVAPAELHVAKLALETAERSFLNSPESYQTRDLSYVAERKSQLAEATASISMEQTKQAQANETFQTAQGKMLSDTKQDLSKTRNALTMSKNNGEMTAEQLADETAARIAAEKQTADALAALAALAAVKEEPRGTVITLSGSVLFASGKTALLPAAMSRLDQVAAVLLENSKRNILVEGHTDSQGSDSYNMNLSQGRADAVRNYLVQRGYQSGLINANGLGEGRPVADNDNPEGRANNRRVEIVIEREVHASN
jgi:outer membrane protein OmpA-like peptidoglycan-associated protein